MTTPYLPLMKEGSENPPQLSRSKLGKDLGRGRFSHAKAEHPWAYASSIASIVIMILFIVAAVQEIRNGDEESILPLFHLLLSVVCFIVGAICMGIMFDPIPTSRISEAQDALFFLKLIATGHSWDEVGRIMNSYLFERGIWWTNSCFYDSEQCYNFFVSYSKGCADPAIEPFIEQAKSKLAESMAVQWEEIQVPGHS
ncbi:DUP super family [Kluyveromyces marxianus]|uniref:DUP super family n=1 Tax=Kluyveromyces marxianus (strain DMKU3-1042 / BCC 29191 / NBRC 104275) TaxID=1003335 RepID=W0T8V8_KLUMD|nr:DUP super family [Kluyveromyces marxianus DMKU3-1042]BAO38529.1 DUP super family [Kluyveromyces marxianus DMKU3-1042]BAP70077.1 DUP super family [Kluyveromyces marxianus]